MVIGYRSTTPWDASFVSVNPLNELGPKPTTPTEIDAWLRHYAQAAEAQKFQRKVRNFRIRPASMISRTVNGHPALSWLTEFTEASENRTVNSAIIYSENAIARLWMQDSMADIDPFLPAIEQMIGTIRLP